MQLTLFSDFALRLLLYLAVHEGQTVPVSRVATAYGVSQNHMVKVAQMLARLGLIESVRGRGGGMRLARPAGRINLGEVVRQTEPHFHLVECFDEATNTCPISPACNLKNVLHRAQQRFLSALDELTLADLMGRERQLKRLWAGAGDAQDTARSR